jgi:hypothetical protein
MTGAESPFRIPWRYGLGLDPASPSCGDAVDGWEPFPDSGEELIERSSPAMTHARAAPGGLPSGAACRADDWTAPHIPTTGVDQALTGLGIEAATAPLWLVVHDRKPQMLDVVVEVELPRVGAEPDLVDLFDALEGEPSLDEVGGEDAAGEQVVLIGLQGGERLLQ